MTAYDAPTPGTADDGGAIHASASNGTICLCSDPANGLSE